MCAGYAVGHVFARRTRKPSRELQAGGVFHPRSVPAAIQAGSRDVCAFCNMAFKSGDACTVLREPCKHVFHAACLEKFNRQTHMRPDFVAFCPRCRLASRVLALTTFKPPRSVIPDVMPVTPHSGMISFQRSKSASVQPSQCTAVSRVTKSDNGGNIVLSVQPASPIETPQAVSSRVTSVAPQRRTSFDLSGGHNPSCTLCRCDACVQNKRGACAQCGRCKCDVCTARQCQCACQCANNSSLSKFDPRLSVA